MRKVIFGVVTALLVVVVFRVAATDSDQATTLNDYNHHAPAEKREADRADVDASGAGEVSQIDPDDPLAGLDDVFEGLPVVDTGSVLLNYNMYQGCISQDSCRPVTISFRSRPAKRRGSSTGPRDHSVSTSQEQGARDEPTVLKYDPRTQKWKDLPLARVARSSDNCVGYCFDAITHSVSDEDPRVARLVVFGTDGRPTRATVQRTRPFATPSSALEERRRFRFACYERSEAHRVPRFDGCKRSSTGMARIEKPRSAKDWMPDPGVFDMTDPL